jgi:hypothetical protein
MTVKRGRPPKPIKEIVLPPTYEQPAIQPSVRNGYEKPELEQVQVITFESIPERVLCPNCHKLQFTVNEGSTNAEIVRKCDKCGTKTIFRFRILPFGFAPTTL